MSHHSSSRNHRSKGSNVKKILQVLVLLAVACWLLYQVKHSREKKTEFTRNDEIKLSKVSEEIHLGRKGDAGSENVVIIDTHSKGSDESTEMKQDEDQHDAPVLNNEDVSSEMHQSHKLTDSQKSKAEQHSYSHTNVGGEIILLPSEKGGNSSYHSGNSNQESHNVEENEHLNNEEKHEDVKSDLVISDVDEVTTTDDQTTSSSADQTLSSKNSGKENEESSADQTESGKNSGKEDEEISSRADSQEVSVNDEASNEKGVGSYEHSSSLPEISIDDAHVSSSESDAATANDQVDDAFHVNGTAESLSDSNHDLKNVDANNEALKEGVESHIDSNHELNNVDGNKEALNEGEVDTQLGIFPEDEKKVNNSSGEMKTSLESEKEMKDSFYDAKAQNSSNTSGVASVESQVDRASVDSQDDKASEQEILSEANNSEVVELQASTEVSGEAENSQSVTDTPEKEISAGDTIDSHGNEESKNDSALNDEAVTSSEVDEKINVDDLTNKIPAGELTETQQQEEAAEQKGV